MYIYSHSFLCGIYSELPPRTYIFLDSIWHHNILCGMGSVLPLHIYILGFYLASQHFMWHGFCTSITHTYIYICSGILSGITTSYVAWVLYFHYTYIFWHSIWHHTTFYVAWVLYFHYTHIFWHSIWHHNILFGVYSGLMSHTYILTFYLYDGIHMNSDKTQELAVLYIAYCIYKSTKQELKLSRTMA